MVRRLRVVLLILTVVAVAFTFSLSALAATNPWSVDSNTSAARLFLGSPANPDAFNTGVARVRGKVDLDPDDLNNSAVDFAIYPSDEKWSGLYPDGSLRAGYVPDSADQTLLTFKSEHVLAPGNGKLEVVGNLTLIRVERSVTIDPTQAYAGPVFGPPVIRTETREVTFEVPDYRAAATAHPQSEIALSASTQIGYENFPGLFSAVPNTNWPPVIANEHCQMPSTIGDDYRGPQCTGTVIAATDNKNCHMPSNLGEGYAGAVCTPPAGNQTTIVVQLNLTEAGSPSPNNIVLSGIATQN